MEHRWGHRSDCDTPIRLRLHNGFADGRMIAARIVNASISGGLLRSPLILPLYCGLDILIGDASVSACVTRHAGPNTIGVEWDELAPAAVIALLSSVLHGDERTRHDSTSPAGSSSHWIPLTGT